MITVLLLRPRGRYHRVVTEGGTTFVETSIEALAASNWQLWDLCDTSSDLGAIILEDMHHADLDDHLRAELAKATAGKSCPIISRWTSMHYGRAA